MLTDSTPSLGSGIRLKEHDDDTPLLGGFHSAVPLNATGAAAGDVLGFGAGGAPQRANGARLFRHHSWRYALQARTQGPATR